MRQPYSSSPFIWRMWQQSLEKVLAPWIHKNIVQSGQDMVTWGKGKGGEGMGRCVWDCGDKHSEGNLQLDPSRQHLCQPHKQINCAPGKPGLCPAVTWQWREVSVSVTQMHFTFSSLKYCSQAPGYWQTLLLPSSHWLPPSLKSVSFMPFLGYSMMTHTHSYTQILLSFHTLLMVLKQCLRL